MVEKGSVCVDGISLTVVEALEGRFTVFVIPLTLRETTLSDARPGARVNIEVDIIGKYVEAFLSKDSGRSDIEEALSRGGYLDQGHQT